MSVSVAVTPLGHRSTKAAVHSVQTEAVTQIHESLTYRNPAGAQMWPVGCGLQVPVLDTAKRSGVE